MDIEAIIVELLPVIVGLVTIALLLPFETFRPRIRTALSAGRIPAILIVGVATIATSMAFSNVFMDEIAAFFQPLKLFSLAKLDLPPVVIFVIGFLLLDLVSYSIHVLSHRVPPLWRLHAIHHSDEHVSAVTGFLHHPFEALVGLVYALFFMIVLGVPLLVITIHALFGATHTSFSHANISIPPAVERILRLIIVTPDMHRTHHSRHMAEGNSNFGSIFPFWDWLFGTYVAHPRGGEDKLAMGLSGTEAPSQFSGLALILDPFRRRRAAAAQAPQL